MPLNNSKKKANIGKNISKEMKTGKPQKQAIAIALSAFRKATGKMAVDQKKRDRQA